MYPALGLFIDGKWKMAGDVSRTEDGVDTSTGKSFALLPDASKADLDEALEAAYALTSSNATATALESRMVGINSVAISIPETPFDGVKEAGHGSEGGIEGLDAYLNVRFVCQA